MELGERIRLARLEAGLSQRQLCGSHITRNMLSQIEHGMARPSMDTLRLLAEGLGKPVSYFLDDQAVVSPNPEVMARSREAFRAGDPHGALEILEDYREPDPVFDAEAGLLRILCRIALAEQAISQDRMPYARTLLARAGEIGTENCYFTVELERKLRLLMAQADPERAAEMVKDLPTDDRELLLRTQVALERGDADRAIAYLDAAQDREALWWLLLRGEAHYALGEFALAAELFLQVEPEYPRQAAARLEACYRELGDFKLAYEYACKQRN